MAASAYQVISKEVENPILRHSRIFRHTYMCKEPVLTKLWKLKKNVQILYSHHTRYTDRLLDVFLFLLTVILSELYEELRK